MLLNYLKRGSYNSFFFGLSSAIVRGINFLFLPFLLSQISLEEFGIWDFYQMLFSYATLFLSSYAATGMIRFFLLYKNDPLRQQKSIGNSFLAAFLGSCICVISLLFFPTKFLSINNTLIIAINISLFTLFSLVLAYLRMHEKVIWYLIIFCGQSILSTIFAMVGIVYGYRLNSLWYANAFSLLFFFPAFFIIWMRHFNFSLPIFKQQITYSLPLLLYSFLYTSFLSLDRWFIQHYQGYEQLGTYALLWRFGSLFQFIAIAIMDTWPLLIFNAQKESNERDLIANLSRAYCFALTTLGVYGIIASQIGILLFLPAQYAFLVNYLPSFFLPIVCLELARVLQAGFALATQTNYIPLIAAGIIPFQILFLFYLCSYSLWGIFAANSLAFILYGYISHHVGNRVYSLPLSAGSCSLVIGNFIFFVSILQILALYEVSIFYSFLIGAIWPFIVFKINITSREQIQIIQWVHITLITLLKRAMPPRKIKIHNLNDVLYLRTDICSQEITAGGSVAHTLGVVNGFLKRNIRIKIASSALQTILKNNFPEDFILLSVPPIFCMMRWKLNYMRWRLESFFSTFIFAKKLRKLFSSHHFDAIYQRYSLLNATGVLLSWRYKVPLIIEYNGSEVWQFDQLAPKNWFKFNWLAKLIERINLEYAASIIVVSEVLKENLISRGITPEKILVNPNGVDSDVYNPELLESHRNQIRNQLGIDDKFVFGFAGTFSFWHGIEVIAAMIPAVIKKNKNVHFILVGDGILKSPLEEKIKSAHCEDFVTLTGLLNHEMARLYLAACDAFLCPTQPMPDGSRFFGSPTKMFEYLSLGKPIIASNLEQLKDIMYPSLVNPTINSHSLLKDQSGFLIDPDNLEGFIDAAVLLTSIPQSIAQCMQITNRNKAQLNYSWQNHVRKIVHFVEKDN